MMFCAAEEREGSCMRWTGTSLGYVEKQMNKVQCKMSRADVYGIRPIVIGQAAWKTMGTGRKGERGFASDTTPSRATWRTDAHFKAFVVRKLRVHLRILCSSQVLMLQTRSSYFVSSATRVSDEVEGWYKQFALLRQCKFFQSSTSSKFKLFLNSGR